MAQPYVDFVRRFALLMEEGRTLPRGGFRQPCPVEPEGPEVLVFAPHPDDESIVGALPLRLLRERNHRVTVVAVTLGGLPERRAARLQELRGACAFLGFEVLLAAEGGLEGIHPRADDSVRSQAVQALASVLESRKPWAVFLPHARDAHSTHRGTHLAVLDALRSLGPGFRCLVVETEFWSPMEAPNLLVESSWTDVADLMAAVSFHLGEVARNPYHLRLPAWMSDNVRRGGERVAGQGAAPPEFQFATLYRARRWRKGRLESYLSGGRLLAAQDDLSAALPEG